MAGRLAGKLAGGEGGGSVAGMAAGNSAGAVAGTMGGMAGTVGGAMAGVGGQVGGTAGEMSPPPPPPPLRRILSGCSFFRSRLSTAVLQKADVALNVPDEARYKAAIRMDGAFLNPNFGGMPDEGILAVRSG